MGTPESQSWVMGPRTDVTCYLTRSSASLAHPALPLHLSRETDNRGWSDCPTLSKTTWWGGGLWVSLSSQIPWIIFIMCDMEWGADYYVAVLPLNLSPSISNQEPDLKECLSVSIHWWADLLAEGDGRRMWQSRRGLGNCSLVNRQVRAVMTVTCAQRGRLW